MKKRVCSVKKGKAAERAACIFLTKLGFPAERGARNGVKGCHDILCPSLGRLLIECKSVKGMGVGTQVLTDAMDTAAFGSPASRRAVVLWFEFRRGWRMTWFEDGCELTVAWPSDISKALHRLNGTAGGCDVDVKSVSEDVVWISGVAGSAGG